MYRRETHLSTHPAANSPGLSNPASRRRVVFMGTPDFVVPVLARLSANPALDVVAVYAPPDRPRGRGRAVEAPPVKQHAAELGIPVFQPPALRNTAVVSQLTGLAPDVIIVAAYGRLLPASVLELPRHGCLNLHPSLLPRHRGPSPVVGAILAGDLTTGISLMLLDEGMDTGPIIAQRACPLSPDDDAQSLTPALFLEGAQLLDESLPGWVAGALPAKPQNDALATYTTKVERADGAADWTLPAETLARRLRAYTPWPGLHTRWGDRELKILEAQAVDGFAVDPGLVVPGYGSRVAIGAGSGMLQVSRLQMEGRRPANADEFLRGYPDFLGAQLGPAVD